MALSQSPGGGQRRTRRPPDRLSPVGLGKGGRRVRVQSVGGVGDLDVRAVSLERRVGCLEGRAWALEDKVGALEEEVRRRGRVEEERWAKVVALVEEMRQMREVSEVQGRRMVELEGEVRGDTGGQVDLEQVVRRMEEEMSGTMERAKGQEDRGRKMEGRLGELTAEVLEMRQEVGRTAGVAKVETEEEVKKVEERLGGELVRLREEVERWGGERGLGEEGVGRSGETVAKVVAAVPREEERALEYVVLTDSNGRGMRPDNIKAHIPRDQRDRFDIRVEIVYTLMEVCGRLERGGLDVCGRAVILDVGTNDVRGTAGVPWVRPGEVGERFEMVARLLLEKGAVGVVGCEVKPMKFMDVTPYSRAIHTACLRLRAHGHRVHGCQTQTGVSHLGKDGYHILPSFAGVLDRTYACAIMGVPVPCPTPSWDKYRGVELGGGWPTPREAQGQGNRHGRG